MSYKVPATAICVVLFCAAASLSRPTQTGAPPPRALGSTSRSSPVYQLPGLPPITKNSSPTQDLANRLRRQANEERSEEDLKKLRELVITEFTERQTAQKEEAESILAKAQEALDILKQRDEKQEEIIEARLRALMGEVGPLDWDYHMSYPVNSSATR